MAGEELKTPGPEPGGFVHIVLWGEGAGLHSRREEQTSPGMSSPH